MTNLALAKGTKLSPEEELKHFKAVVRSLMSDAAVVLADIESLSGKTGAEEKFSLLNHYLDYTIRLCEKNTGKTF